MTSKYEFGKIEKHPGDNEKPRRNKRMGKNGEDCHRLEMTSKYKFDKIKKHQGDNDKPRRNKDGQEWPRKNGEDCHRL